MPGVRRLGNRDKSPPPDRRKHYEITMDRSSVALLACCLCVGYDTRSRAHHSMSGIRQIGQAIHLGFGEYIEWEALERWVCPLLYATEYTSNYAM